MYLTTLFQVVAIMHYGCFNRDIVIWGWYTTEKTDTGIPVKEVLGLYKKSPEDNYIYVQSYPTHLKGWNQIRYDEPSVSWYIQSVEEIFSDAIRSIKIFSNTSANSSIAEENSPASGNLFLLVGDTYIPTELIVQEIEDLNFTEFGEALHAVVPFLLSFEQSQLVCRALGGGLAAPHSAASSDFLFSLTDDNDAAHNNDTYWTGYYRSSSNSSWLWNAYDGEGIVFENDAVGIDNLSGCVFVSSLKLYEVSDCFTTRKFVCQTRQYYFYQDTWVKVYQIKRDQKTAQSVCEGDSRTGRLLNSFHYSTFVLQLLSKFHPKAYEGIYWTDAMWNSSLITYQHLNGEAVQLNQSEIEFFAEYHCIALTDHGDWMSYPCQDKVGFVCLYAPQPEGFIGSYQHNDEWIWLSNARYNYEEAANSCYGHDQQMFVINSEDDFTQLTYLLYEWISEPIEVPLKNYAKDVSGGDERVTFNLPANHKIWLKVASPENFAPMFSVEEPNDGNISSCLVLVKDSTMPVLKRKDCFEVAHFMCASGNKYNFTDFKRKKHCPNDFSLFGNVCYAYQPISAMWSAALGTCQNWGSLARLVDDNDGANSWRNAVLGTYCKLRKIDRAWTGMCANGSDLLWASDVETVKLPLDYTAGEGTCAGIHVNVSTPVHHWIIAYPWSYHLPFICEARPTFEAWNKSKTLHTAHNENQALWSSPFCPDFYLPYAEKQGCFGVSSRARAWDASCNDESVELATFEMLEDHHLLQNLAAVFRFVFLKGFWIGLRKNSEGARWLGSDADLSYSAWKAEPTENNSCVVLDRDGYWSVQPCHDNHFALCRKQECYRDWDLLSYQGKVNTTVSGFACQDWSSQITQGLNYSGDPANFCRAYEGYYAPFCYTKNPEMSYESCPIPICGNSYTASLTSTSADETYLSNWLIADGTLSCPSGYLLANCHCANEHCRGAEFQPASSSEPNSVDQCLILFQSSQQQLPVMTRDPFC